MKLDGCRVTVVGLGITGLSLVPFLAGKGAHVTVSDRRSSDMLSREIDAVSQYQVTLDLGAHSEEAFTDADMIVISPGVPYNLPPLRKAREHGVLILGELELAFLFLKTPAVAVTGTNGKSTTVKLMGHLLDSGGKSAFVCGNIGTPLIEYVSGPQVADIVVVEVSSFQLETAQTFRPHWAVVLNVSPDHLDRYENMDEYVHTKATIFRNQDNTDRAILNFDDAQTKGMASGISSEILFFSRIHTIDTGAYVQGESVVLCRKRYSKPENISLAGATLRGSHNQENIMAAVLLARDVGIGTERIHHGLTTFHPLDHRVEFVAQINGVDFFDDSKGTNVGATCKALEGFDRKVVLILGGRDKNSDFNYLFDVVRNKTRAVVMVGEARHTIHCALRGAAPSYLVNTFEEAVYNAYALAMPGDAVLLSPACASFDMFDNYSHRGQVFQKLVRTLKENGRTGKIH